jgi:hypothetical protein
MKEVISDLQARRKVLQAEIDTIDNAIEALRKVCKHDWASESDRHDFHYKHEVCKICGESAKI